MYLSEADADRIAAHLRLSNDDFEKRFLFRTKHLRRLRKPRNAECPFLKTQGCAIHEVKPTQCRTFPLWPEILESSEELAQTARWCPGLGQGPDVLIEDIRDCTEQMRQAYPTMYED